ncbi:hypothetical protein SAMN05720354_11428 [Nitrosospira sp. Nsp1]|nr:hypothetical protein SAMN05720354_11428 [Nitrosospira sp. Nsp1]
MVFTFPNCCVRPCVKEDVMFLSLGCMTKKSIFGFHAFTLEVEAADLRTANSFGSFVVKRQYQITVYVFVPIPER